MNTLKLVSILILLCGVLSFSGCLGDGGNTLSVYSTGSIYKTSTGTSYMFIDRAGISATSAELQSENLELGDRILATTTIDFDNQGTQLAQGIYNATIAGVHKFDCKNYTFDNSISSFASDTLPTLYGVEPFLSYRKDDTILTFAYVKHDVENGDPSSLKSNLNYTIQKLKQIHSFSYMKKGISKIAKARTIFLSNYLNIRVTQILTSL